MIKPAIVYVHGAFASQETMTLNYYKLVLSEYEEHTFCYDWNRPTDEVGHELYEFILINAKIGQPVYVIGHSLGGNVALWACMAQSEYDHKPISHVFTVGSPLGGSKAASFLRYGINAPRVFKHITPTNSLIRDLQCDPGVSVTSFVTTKGLHSRWVPPNDGVVTQASQQALVYPEYVHVDCNHMEVLLSDTVVTHISHIINTNETRQ
jgi:triacylglycerol esterase/lipase EstA (alpha/beta hydrolase family)